MFFPLFERLFIVLLLLSSMNFFTALTPSSREPANVKTFSADVDMVSVVIDASILMYGGILVLLHWRRVLRAARRVWPLLMLVGLACVSVLWSVEPMVTLRRSVWLAGATMIAIYLGERYSIKAFASILARTLCLMMAMVVVVYLIAPEYIIDYSAYGGAWKGLSTYKNTFGEHMAVAALVLVLVRFERFVWLRYLFLLLAGILLVLSHSATALFCGVLSLAAIGIWRLMRGEQRLVGYLLAALAISLAVYCIVAPPELLFNLLGRDPTLTGRTRLWAVLLPVITNRPLLGYGFGAFWAGLKPEVVGVWIGAGRLAPIADNGYIDLLLSLGFVGAGVFLWTFVRSFRHAIDFAHTEFGSIAFWPVTYLCFFAVHNIGESTLLTTGTFPFLLFAVLTTSLAVNKAPVRAHEREHEWAWEGATVASR